LISIFTEKIQKVWYAGAIDRKGKLIACSFSPRSHKEALRGVIDSLPKKMIHQPAKPSVGKAYARRLHSIFIARRSNRTLQIDFSRNTLFARRVYGFVSRIPRGQVMTYGGVASALGGRKYSRAVGRAMASNPLPLIVPCHRVVPSTLTVGNYGLGHYPSPLGSSIKHNLLKREGVRFNGNRISRKSVWKPTT
jgi:O-6-methylguanine DNA methyltransferase